ncbi:M24 family metallopeptidase [Melghirimyces algeriensis]|uniref:M24 family metallopeptidase n=1 Tax=Melghirimyces algeriensis TaxID=910412 RepID=UPI001FE59C74|nr:M24 family metallopeptidase [Melghirimyces algeriensis]
MLPFSVSEYTERLRRVKHQMEKRGLDILVVTDPANMNYLSGYDAWSFYVPQALVVISDEEQPIWIGRKQDAGGAKLTTWFHPNRIIPYPDDYVQAFDKHPMDFVAEILNQIGKSKRRMGVEQDSYYFSARSMDRLQRKMPHTRFFDATLLVNRVRLVKSDQEIEYMRRAARIVERAMRAGLQSIGVGVRECDVAANISYAQISGTPDYGGDYPSIVPLLPSGIKTCTPHLTWTDRQYQKGDAVILELAGCYKRYHAPMARTAVIGSASPKVVDLANVVIEGLTKTLDAIQPGMTCEELEWTWRQVVEGKGYHKDSRLGYSVGLNYPPDWGEHIASIRSGDSTVLKPNMTFHLIPGIWLDHYGVEFSETFRVTETGCEVLTHFPRELYQLPELPLSTISIEESGA